MGGVRLAAESHGAAIDRIEATARDEGIDCHFERLDGYLFAAPGTSPDVLRRERDAAHAAGLTSVALVARAPFPSFDTGPALRFPRQGQFHVLKYVTGLAVAIERHGGRIFCDTRATIVEGGDSARVVTAHGTIRSDAVVVASTPPAGC